MKVRNLPLEEVQIRSLYGKIMHETGRVTIKTRDGSIPSFSVLAVRLKAEKILKEFGYTTASFVPKLRRYMGDSIVKEYKRKIGTQVIR
jgi:hypothetical protein